MEDSIKQKLLKLNHMPVTEYKKAGVFIGILYFNEYIKNPHIIFTQRSTKLSSHSGEVSYPGGKWEDGDIDLLDTALRESNEEINLNRSDVVALGNLPYLISRHKIEVHPYVGLITNEQDLKGNFEIEEIFTVPVSFLKDKKNAKMHDKIKGDLDLKIPSWDYNNQRIWGLTAMITADLINICFDGKIETNLTQIREQYDSYPRG
ncbi:CoA pyrophosphatase [Gammaproteobacteria bacterium]|nr:CoA pyrophosphatase [Gammaproteobacteria bacterium]MDA9997734.1 CoA pyrophosphatase [Gammaproteobacteria bacterium]MDC1123686.1 CoA pyrophosphatase [Gammaproteobacteria bacterium]MDC3248343.1 CoA pyrophosphatase [Gammaproteobacteria bacterium]MDC3302364.1 CoA pyrophosphatase [Gammaproteobacteria bacterium]